MACECGKTAGVYSSYRKLPEDSKIRLGLSTRWTVVSFLHTEAFNDITRSASIILKCCKWGDEEVSLLLAIGNTLVCHCRGIADSMKLKEISTASTSFKGYPILNIYIHKFAKV